ncbi:MAG: NAD(P)/FAD-dependent oxidoreductase [Parvibaculaceae bacterium]|nr:NAD(P)/FAD-dependent oxidoreductase [Parvibaculaceae bacterium]
MTKSYDHIVIGAGHNGLTAAAYLAKAGGRVLVLEARDAIGGASATAEIAPGYKVSTCAHLLNQLHPRVAKDLGLASHGLKFAGTDLPTTVLGASGAVLRAQGDNVEGAISPADRAKYAAFRKKLLKFSKRLQPMLLTTPPRLLNRDFKQNMDLLKLGWAIRSLGRTDMREFLRVAGMNVYDLVRDDFESDLVQVLFANDAVLGTSMGPRSPGTVLTLLYRLTGEIAGRQGALALPQGGMGAVADALAAAATKAGAEIRTAAPVARILIENDRAVGVVLSSGEEIRAGHILSNADPRTTFVKLVGARHLDAGFQRDVTKIRTKGMAAKLNLALDSLPAFTGLNQSDLAGRVILSESIEQIENAFNPAKYGEYSPTPLIELTIPSVADPSLTGPGKHVLSAIVQYAPYHLKAGWDAAREDFLKTIMARLENFAPGIGKQVVASQLLTPLDLEREYGLPGGHWHHGELAIDQLLMLRPVAAASRYEGPIAGLYLCGAGAHPGGGVMGAAGHNAARTVLEARKSGEKAA